MEIASRFVSTECKAKQNKTRKKKLSHKQRFVFFSYAIWVRFRVSKQKLGENVARFLLYLQNFCASEKAI